MEFKNKLQNTLLIGGDPEFEILDPFFAIKGANSLFNSCVFDDPIGTDGNSRILELRPDPGSSVDAVARNFEKLLIDFKKIFPGYIISSVGDAFPLGHHIHLSCPRSDNLTAFLDTLIGIPLLSLNSGIRREKYYVGLGNVRKQPHGFEYRSGSGIWSHPRLLKIITSALTRLFQINEFEFTYGNTAEVFEKLGLDYNEFKSLINFLEVKRNRLHVLGNWGVSSFVFKWPRSTSFDLLNRVVEANNSIPACVYNLKSNEIPFVISTKVKGEIISFEDRPLPLKFISSLNYFRYSDHIVFFGLSPRVRRSPELIDSAIEKLHSFSELILKEELK